MSALDPTREELLAHLRVLYPSDDDFSECDREEAVYYFAHDYHSGQGSNLYAALSTSPYRPGPCQRAPEEAADLLYEELVDSFDREPARGRRA
jgi:hypothetical protein